MESGHRENRLEAANGRSQQHTAAWTAIFIGWHHREALRVFHDPSSEIHLHASELSVSAICHLCASVFPFLLLEDLGSGVHVEIASDSEAFDTHG